MISENGLTRTYREIEEPLIKILAEMEYTGVAIDLDYLARLINDSQRKYTD